MGKDCPKCAFWRERGAPYCSNCGKYLGKPSNEGQSVLHLFTQATAALVTLVVVINTLYCLFNFNAIYESCKDLSFGISVSIGLEDYVITRVTGIGVLFMFIALLVIESACLAYAVYRHITAIKNCAATGDDDASDTTGLSAASTYLVASLILGIVYFAIAAALGNTADTSWMDEYTTEQLTFMLTRAGVREELMFRVLWIGIPMVIVAAIVLKDRRCLHYLFGGFGMSKIAFVLILSSSTIFGLGHYDGWGWTKVLEAAMGGMIFAYLYVEYGLYASIIAHTANDTLSSIGYVAGTGIEGLFVLAMFGLGIAAIVRWLIKPNRELVNPMLMPTLPKKLEGGFLTQWKRH